MKKQFHEWLIQLAGCRQSDSRKILEQQVSNDCNWLVAHPVNHCPSIETILSDFIQPLKQALNPLVRRDLIVMSGESVTGSGQWIACMGHYVGNFNTALFGIPASQKLCFLRYGEFYQRVDNRIVKARILLDLVDLMRQCGHMPLPRLLGNEMTFPAPATQDGLMFESTPDEQSARSVELVNRMLNDLSGYDPDTFQSPGQTGKNGYWHEHMLWYGPGGIGSNYTYPGFDKDHRIAFLTAFPDRVGGNHYARFGDGNYVASGGWPSITATHRGEYLGIAATNKLVTMRVMDFWRAQQDQLIENWVFIDMLDLCQQLGVDLLTN